MCVFGKKRYEEWKCTLLRERKYFCSKVNLIVSEQEKGKTGQKLDGNTKLQVCGKGILKKGNLCVVKMAKIELLLQGF